MRFAAALALVVAPIGAGAATFDLAGRWEVATSNHQIVGVCPPGSDFTTYADLFQSGDTFSFDLDSGMLGGPCQPPAVCQLAGTIAGARYSATSGPVVVDDEGGVAEVTVDFTAASAEEASGQSVQTYALDDFECTWTMDLGLQRVPEPTGARAGSAAAAALLALRLRRRGGG